MGVALAHFQSSGKMPLFSDLLNKIDSGTEINSLTYLITDIGHLSGPGDFLFCRAVNLLNTSVGVSSKESLRRGELVGSTSNTNNMKINFRGAYDDRFFLPIIILTGDSIIQSCSSATHNIHINTHTYIQ